MIVVRIEGQEFNLPEGWHEVNLEKFSKIIKLNDRISEWKSTIEFSIEIFSTLLGVEKSKIELLTRASFNTLLEETKWLYSDVPSTPKDEFTLLGKRWRILKDLNKLTMGESISLELKISESDNSTILSNIIPILLREIVEVKEDGKTTEVLQAFRAEDYTALKEECDKSIMVTEIISFKDFFLSGATVSSGPTKATSVNRAKSRKTKKVETSI
jgi:hypothetical protein